MKRKIQNFLATFVYSLYMKGILKNHIHVHTIDETIAALTGTDKSLIRFGEGEIILIEGLSNATQVSNDQLGKRMQETLLSTKENPDPNLLLSFYDIFDGLDHVRPQNRPFWLRHLLRSRKTYEKNLNHDIVYENTFLTRCYYSFSDKSQCKKWFDGIKNIWAGKDIILVEGQSSHIGVGNDLFEKAKSVKRILGPSRDAYASYDEIYKKCLEVAKDQKDNKDLVFLLGLGATAKPLAYDLYHQGYRVIDIGNVDLEYEWFLMGTEEKQDLPKQKVLGKEANIAAGYTEYVDQVVATIGV